MTNKSLLLSAAMVALISIASPAHAETADVTTETNVSIETAAENIVDPLTETGKIAVANSYAYATTDAQENGAAFFLLANNTEENDRLISAHTDVAEKTEIHTHEEDEGTMKMRAVESIDVPVGNVIGFAPNGHHIMLMGLKHPLNEGDEVKLTLTFETAGDVETTVMVKAPYDASETDAENSHDDMAADHDDHDAHADVDANAEVEVQTNVETDADTDVEVETEVETNMDADAEADMSDADMPEEGEKVGLFSKIKAKIGL